MNITAYLAHKSIPYNGLCYKISIQALVFFFIFLVPIFFLYCRKKKKEIIQKLSTFSSLFLIKLKE